MNDNPAQADTTEIDRIVGQRIREAFAAADIDDATAADFLGISIALLHEVYAGNVRCTPVTLMVIAEATNKSVAFFFRDAGDPIR